MGFKHYGIKMASMTSRVTGTYMMDLLMDLETTVINN
jgi:hypothetical protein